MTLPDGESGVVAEVVFRVLGFDFWPKELIVSTRTGRRSRREGADPCDCLAGVPFN